MPEVLAESGK
uniref:Uncharacterized protein n=1 Tax=Rhizophora mucronata TaxID=61149 RepID=A0A2P2PN90_RHIMU